MAGSPIDGLDPELSEKDRPTHQPLNNELLLPLDYQSGNEESSLIATGLGSIPYLGTDCMPWPNSLTLTQTEVSALVYYEQILMRHVSTKDPAWSTTALLLRVSAHNAMVMHLLLSTTMREMSLAHGRDSSLLRSAERHYQAGMKLLVEETTKDTEPDHIAVMSAFLFLYFFKAQQRAQDSHATQLLSKAIKNHVEMFGLHLLVAGTKFSSSPVLTGKRPRCRQTLPPREQSLLARLMTWMYYADVQNSFQGCGGNLARMLDSHPGLTNDIYDQSRPILELNWGSGYPYDQALDDVENSIVLELFHRVFRIMQQINEASRNLTRLEEHETSAIDEQLSRLRIKYSPIFNLAARSTGPRNRLLCNIDTTVAHFYTLRLYQFVLVSPPCIQPPPAVQEGLSLLFSLAQRSLTHGVADQRYRLAWPLFFAGIVTDDAIYQDWVLGHMPPCSIRDTLNNIISLQRSLGVKRLPLDNIRQILRPCPAPIQDC